VTAGPAALLQAQTDRLVDLGYPALAGLDEAAFRDRVAPLASALPRVDAPAPEEPGTLPFVLVVTRDLVRPEATVPLLRLAGGAKPGVVDRNHGEDGLAAYHPLPELEVPAASAYLLVGVERGEEFCGVRAVVTHAPHLLERNKCFMLSGSRRHDRRVPALWISERAPKLGWCWDGNPHTWLGVASAAARAA
jgi:hypothetical protein